MSDTNIKVRETKAPKATHTRVTPLQIAKYGHVAELLRREMLARGLTMVQLAKALNTTSAAVSHWTRCQNGPGTKMRRNLAKLLGVEPAFLKAREVRELETEARANTKTLEITLRKQHIPDVLSFTVDAEGNARLRLDVILPIEHAAPLFRLLLDAGLVGPKTTELVRSNGESSD